MAVKFAMWRLLSFCAVVQYCSIPYIHTIGLVVCDCC
jgi:hypothetical protein